MNTFLLSTLIAGGATFDVLLFFVVGILGAQARKTEKPLGSYPGACSAQRKALLGSYSNVSFPRLINSV